MLECHHYFTAITTSVDFSAITNLVRSPPFWPVLAQVCRAALPLRRLKIAARVLPGLRPLPNEAAQNLPKGAT